MDQMQRVSNVSKVATVMVSASRAKRINVRGAGESVDTKIKKHQFKPISKHLVNKENKNRAAFLKIMHLCTFNYEKVKPNFQPLQRFESKIRTHWLLILEEFITNIYKRFNYVSIIIRLINLVQLRVHFEKSKELISVEIVISFLDNIFEFSSRSCTEPTSSSWTVLKVMMHKHTGIIDGMIPSPCG